MILEEPRLNRRGYVAAAGKRWQEHVMIPEEPRLNRRGYVAAAGKRWQEHVWIISGTLLFTPVFSRFTKQTTT
jgi:hypothetical protein